MKKKEVYKFELLSVASDHKINDLGSKKDNIEIAATEPVGVIFAYKTKNPNYYRELVTGKPIPVYRIVVNNSAFRRIKEVDVPSSATYIKICEAADDKKCIDRHYSLLDINPSEDEIYNYILKNTINNGTNFIEYYAKLNIIFENGEKNYKNNLIPLSKEELKEKEKKAKILKRYL